MNAYRWKQLAVGLTATFSVEVTAAQLDHFRAAVGDTNPLHQDPEFARARGFGGVVGFGMLTAGFYSTLVGVHLPGRDALLHAVDASFLKPVYVDDRLVVTGTITYLNDAYRQLEIAAAITNQHGVKVSKAKIKAGLHG